MRVMKGSGQGDVNITGDEHEEDVPGNETVNKDLDELNRMMKENPETEPPLIYNRTAQIRKSNHVYKKPPFDDLYPYRTSTKWPPVSNSSNTTWPVMDLMDHSVSDDWLNDFEKLDQAVKDWKNSHIPEQRHTHFNKDFKPHIDTPEPTPCRQNFFGGSGIFFLMAILTIAVRRWYNRGRPDTVLVTGAGPGAVDQHLKRDMMPPAQREAVPPYIEVPPPYYCSDHPPPFPKDTKESKDDKNGLVETGFPNETTTHSDTQHVETEFLSENGRKVEEQGTRSADGRDSVVYVDEKSTSV